MNYEEYIDNIEVLKTSSDLIIKDKLLNSNTDKSLIPMIEPKIEILIKTKFQDSINKMINNLEIIFSDNYALDQYLVNFKKEILFIYDLTNINELTENKKNELKKMIKDETEKVYDILITKSNQIDLSGSLSIIIKNNKIKWGD